MNERAIFLLIIGGTCYDNVVIDYYRYFIFYNEIVDVDFFVHSLTQKGIRIHNWRMDNE